MQPSSLSESECNVDGTHWVRVAEGRVLALTNDGRGDCLFRAISHQLGGNPSAAQLRTSAVDFLAAHVDEHGPQLLGLGFEMIEAREIPAEVAHGDLIGTVLTMLRLPFIWAGGECVLALANHLGRRIELYREDEELLMINPGPGCGAQDSGPPIQIVHRFGRGQMGRSSSRTHYEAVVNVDLRGHHTSNEVPQHSGEVDKSIGSDAVRDRQLSVGAGSKDKATQTDQPSPSLAPSPVHRILRPRLKGKAPCYMSTDFSDPEEIPDEEDRPFKECRICHERVGRYALLPCGAFPFCGHCIHQWFVELNDVPCTECGGRVLGWCKVFNQN